MHTHESHAPGFQPQVGISKPKSLGSRPFEVTFPGQELIAASANPFVQRSANSWATPPASPSSLPPPSPDGKTGGANIELDWRPQFNLYAARQPALPPPHPWNLQAKLTIGRVIDPYEQEADRAPEQVVSMALPATSNLQRQEKLEDQESIQAKCKTCTAEEQVQRSSSSLVQTKPAHGQIHVVQQVNGFQSVPFILQRACLSSTECSGPIAGSAEEFSQAETAREVSPRQRRARMTPERARSTGHVGHARQLETFLSAQSPGLLSNVHGIFIDQDMSPDTGAYVSNCTSMVPPILGATKPCVFVPAPLNQEALAFNTSTASQIGNGPRRRLREDWRVSTLQTLTHEVQHIVFDTAAHTTPPGVACSRSTVAFELSELSAIMSEFPVAYRAIPAAERGNLTHPAWVRLINWFNWSITNPYESIRGALKSMRCQCDCADVDAYITDTFNETSAAWSASEKAAFNTELRKSAWNLNWPL